MTEPYIAEIRLFGFSFPPRGWAQCNGEILPIDQNQALFSLLSTNYGGNGRTDFALPDLRGRVPIHRAASGSLTSLGTQAGEDNLVLTESDMPSHNHTMLATSDNATNPDPEGHLLAHVGASSLGFIYTTNSSPTLNTSLSSSAIANNSGGQPIDNMQPFLAVNFCIATTGTFPPRN